MRHQKKKGILDRNKASRKALLRGLASNLVLVEKFVTTEAKAKTLKPIMEKLITIAKINNLTSKRKLLEYLYTEKQVNKLMNDIAPRFKNRPGGYLRIIKIGARKGDGAKTVQIEIINEQDGTKQ